MSFSWSGCLHQDCTLSGSWELVCYTSGCLLEPYFVNGHHVLFVIHMYAKVLSRLNCIGHPVFQRIKHLGLKSLAYSLDRTTCICM